MFPQPLPGSPMGRNVGVAKEAALVAVRVLDCQGSGVVSDVMAGARSTLHSHSGVTLWHKIGTGGSLDLC